MLVGIEKRAAKSCEVGERTSVGSNPWDKCACYSRAGEEESDGGDGNGFELHVCGV